MHLQNMKGVYVFFIAVLLVTTVFCSFRPANGALSKTEQHLVDKANENGPYLGLVIPNAYEMDPLLQSPHYTASSTMDIAGRRFRFGTIDDKRVILVMSGLSVINAAITTQLLLSIFSIEGVVHYGIAGNANPSLHIGDVAIPQYWAHTALWNWQRYGDGKDNLLALESNGDYTRGIGYIKISNFTTTDVGACNSSSSYDNLLNNIWYQPEEVFPVYGTPEERQHAFWVEVNPTYYQIAKDLEDMTLENCLNSTTCLTTAPKVVRVERGTSAGIYLDNAAYRSFIYNKFNVSPVDMESSSVSLICLQQNVPFIAIRALSDLAGGGSSESNEADTFSSLAATNSVAVVIEFVKQLALNQSTVSN